MTNYWHLAGGVNKFAGELHQIVLLFGNIWKLLHLFWRQTLVSAHHIPILRFRESLSDLAKVSRDLDGI